MSNSILGIDLGTYNSAAAVLFPEGRILIISAAQDRRFWKTSRERIKPFPSVVVYSPDGTVRAVGYEAKALAESEPEFAVWGMKRLLGKTYKEALEHGELDRMLLPVEPDGTNGRCMFEIGDKEISPEDVCAEMLRYIREAAEEQAGEKLTDVVISVPAYFDAIHVGATVDAAKRAGFAHLDTIPEPVAAALAHELEVTPRPLNFLVFDVGAGTLDVTAAEVWRSEPGPAGLKCRCLKNTGDTHLGGLDMDDRLVAHVKGEMKLGMLSDDERLQMRRAVEAAKIRLSSETETPIEFQVQGERLACMLMRTKLEEILCSEPKDLLGACEDQVREALRGAQWRPEGVNQLLLVGGPTAMPCVRHVLENVFRRNPSVLSQIRQTGTDEAGFVDPMLAVAVGAAKSRGTTLRKIHPYGYGFVNVRVEPGDPLWKEIREPKILMVRDSVFPSPPIVVTPDNPFYRGDNIFSIEVIQHVPDAEQKIPGLGERKYRFLGICQLAFTPNPLITYIMQVSMQLNENGELETTIRNLMGSESVTYVGVGSLQRHPVELPTSKLIPPPSKHSGRWVFIPENAGAIKQWGDAFSRFLRAKVMAGARRHRDLDEALDELQMSLTRWGGFLQSDANRVYNAGNNLLWRALELRLMAEPEKHGWQNQLEEARRRCYRYEEE